MILQSRRDHSIKEPEDWDEFNFRDQAVLDECDSPTRLYATQRFHRLVHEEEHPWDIRSYAGREEFVLQRYGVHPRSVISRSATNPGKLQYQHFEPPHLKGIMA